MIPAIVRRVPLLGLCCIALLPVLAAAAEPEPAASLGTDGFAQSGDVRIH